MKKKILMITPYILGAIYLIYCLCNLNDWVKSHFGFAFYVFLPFAIAVLMSLIWITFYLFGKKNPCFDLPLFLARIGMIIFFVLIGIIISVVGSSIPCCTGG